MNETLWARVRALLALLWSKLVTVWPKAELHSSDLHAEVARRLDAWLLGAGEDASLLSALTIEVRTTIDRPRLRARLAAPEFADLVRARLTCGIASPPLLFRHVIGREDEVRVLVATAEDRCSNPLVLRLPGGAEHHLTDLTQVRVGRGRSRKDEPGAANDVVLDDGATFVHRDAFDLRWSAARAAWLLEVTDDRRHTTRVRRGGRELRLQTRRFVLAPSDTIVLLGEGEARFEIGVGIGKRGDA